MADCVQSDPGANLLSEQEHLARAGDVPQTFPKTHDEVPFTTEGPQGAVRCCN